MLDPAIFDQIIDELAAAGWKLVPVDADEVDLAAELKTARVLSVYGPFHERVLIDMSTRVADVLFPDQLPAPPSEVLNGALADIADLAEKDEDLAASSLAGTLMEMARALAHPFNSATSKAACAAQLKACRDRLFELAGDDDDTDELDALLARLTSGDTGDGKPTADPAVGSPDDR